jgi:hypothetical protein
LLRSRTRPRALNAAHPQRCDLAVQQTPQVPEPPPPSRPASILPSPETASHQPPRINLPKSWDRRLPAGPWQSPQVPAPCPATLRSSSPSVAAPPPSRCPSVKFRKLLQSKKPSHVCARSHNGMFDCLH